MYRANPRVNVELRQRLPSPSRLPISGSDRLESNVKKDLSGRPQASQNLLDFPVSWSPSPVSHRRSVSPTSSPSFRNSASPLSFSFQKAPGEMEADLSPSRGPSPWAESYRDSPDEGPTCRGPGSPGLRPHLVTAGDNHHQTSASAPLHSFDRDKNISFLLKELDSLREVNNKLQEQLVHKEKELQRRELDEELMEEQREARHWERPTLVLEEVLASQKDRDQALMSRLLLANEERDEALLRARRLQQAAGSEDLHLQDSDMDVEELLQGICEADSIQDIHQFGSVLIQRLQLARQRRHDITSQEMTAVMEERDKTVAKYKKLEEDLLQHKEQWASQDELLRLQRENDAALKDRQRLEAEIQALRANHSSDDLTSPSLSSDVMSPSDSLAAAQEAPSPQSPALLLQLQQLSREKQSMEAELQRCQEAEREASERVRRLERLVEVLRKKVGTGSLRAVI
ncbi:mirror-image polydactyly gene 1 protein isoform X2 [Melanotaenia boesemani]|uniref:mirror-image polydactyly gene 1 protein isoform X2 n=1 Tax=Melanotaenia boesemani TaxID=1250792 RepID=UPI001C04C596|nr:mirror-image polydactyly gene 1 protein isoform X2 [Melanotaenia boesemani]XP_041827909.1 mirror-image polydactyly gene 1 protein isoform X2 [Melanotaenia boesemani]